MGLPPVMGRNSVGHQTGPHDSVVRGRGLNLRAT
jgi:hypothetical protein